jgi:hypothetical protein
LECCNQQHRSCQYYPPGQWTAATPLFLANFLLLLEDKLSKVEGKKANQRHLQYVLRFLKHSQICKTQTTLRGASR